MPDQPESNQILSVINEAAEVYRGVIPPNCWHDPYMSIEALLSDIEDGVHFIGRYHDKRLVAVMGIQHRGPVDLIRHAYVLPRYQRQGLGEALISSCHALARAPLLVGTWASATWAIRFYQKQGFRLTRLKECQTLLKRYWQIPGYQAEVSVVLRYEGKSVPPR